MDTSVEAPQKAMTGPELDALATSAAPQTESGQGTETPKASLSQPQTPNRRGFLATALAPGGALSAIGNILRKQGDPLPASDVMPATQSVDVSAASEPATTLPVEVVPIPPVTSPQAAS